MGWMKEMEREKEKVNGAEPERKNDRLVWWPQPTKKAVRPHLTPVGCNFQT